MWNKRDDLPGAKPGQRPMPVEPPRHDAAPMQPPAALTPPKEHISSSAAAIGSSMVIKGDIFSREELYVDGEVDGKLELQHRLTIGPRGKVRAQIRAREVVIAGTVEGNVEVSEKITIQRNGSLIGDIKTAGIVIDDGAYFKGSIDIVKSPPIKKPESAKPAQAAQAAQPAQAAQTSQTAAAAAHGSRA